MMHSTSISLIPIILHYSVCSALNSIKMFPKSFLAILFCMFFERGDAGYAVVTYYKGFRFTGPKKTVDLHPGNCINLSSFFDNTISSMNTHGNCVLVYYRQNCRRASYEISSGCNQFIRALLSDRDQ